MFHGAEIRQERGHLGVVGGNHLRVPLQDLVGEALVFQLLLKTGEIGAHLRVQRLEAGVERGQGLLFLARLLPLTKLGFEGGEQCLNLLESCGKLSLFARRMARCVSRGVAERLCRKRGRVDKKPGESNEYNTGDCFTQRTVMQEKKETVVTHGDFPYMYCKQSPDMTRKTPVPGGLLFFC